MKADFQTPFYLFLRSQSILFFLVFGVDWLLRLLFFLGLISGGKTMEIRQKLQKGRKSQVLLD
jgi:hypothetical protein